MTGGPGSGEQPGDMLTGAGLWRCQRERSGCMRLANRGFPRRPVSGGDEDNRQQGGSNPDPLPGREMLFEDKPGEENGSGRVERGQH